VVFVVVAVGAGVWSGVRATLGPDAKRHAPFTWWVINRLLFLAAVGSIQGFALYYLRDVLLLPDAERWTGILLAFVALFLIASALGGGYLADRLGRRRLVMASAVVAALGTFLLLLARDTTLVLIAGSILGVKYRAQNVYGRRMKPPVDRCVTATGVAIQGAPRHHSAGNPSR